MPDVNWTPTYGQPGPGTGWEDGAAGGTPETGAALDNMVAGIQAALGQANAAAADPRLSDARTPLGHHVTHELGGSDQLSLAAALVTSGTLDPARLPDLSGDYAPAASRLVTTPLVRQHRNNRRLGPVTTDITSAVFGGPNASFTQAYIAGAGPALPAGWPADLGQGLDLHFSGGYVRRVTSTGQYALRMMTDSSKLAILLLTTATTGYQVFIDDAPVTLTPQLVGAAGQYLILTFPTAATRTVEVRSNASVYSIYVIKPYRCWTPPPLAGARGLVVGDSYVAATVWQDGAAAYANTGFGVYQGIEDYLDIQDWWIDGVGGTGYVATASNYLSRLANHIRVAPDVVVLHGGGADDLFNNVAQADIIAAAVSYITQFHAALPKARIVFVEGFAPPLGFSTFNPAYTAIRQAVQTALAPLNCVTYVDVSTSAPWVDGTGYYAHTTGVGNADTYVGNDGVHLTVAGQSYVKARIAPKIQAVLSDSTGALVNQLI